MTEASIPEQTDQRLVIEELRKTYGTGAAAKVVLDGLNFDVRSGEFVCIVGPSGAGKTTLLKCLAGLLPPTSGASYLDGIQIDGPPEKLALVFQEYTRSLMPWLTVEKNVTLPLSNKGISKRERRTRAQEALEAVGLADVPSKYPWQLSGGMQQRVAIARALAYQPEVLMMDEPFASVDAQTRFELEDLTLRVREQFGITIVLVTHDIDEAVYLADRVVVLGSAPAQVREIIDVDVTSPRDQVKTKADPRFTELRSRVFELIRAR
ncbi:ABC transporter ATP-binding protein [Haloechinothrix halophila]|uniref:ABC transporter ATP-binding protein n=1 Tax=Haloechinothrix halophila TaxID=1069073 RepID=UPI000404CA71|nr:ABC transporter ATP-binding protein [Haloechinothrix halophila]